MKEAKGMAAVSVSKKVRLNFDHTKAADIPVKYVNHIEVRETPEEVFLTLYTRMDHLADITSADPHVDLISNGTFVISKPHAARLAQALLMHSEKAVERSKKT